MQTEKKRAGSYLVVSTYSLGSEGACGMRGWGGGGWGGGGGGHATRTASGVTERLWLCLLISTGSDLV